MAAHLCLIKVLTVNLVFSHIYRNENKSSLCTVLKNSYNITDKYLTMKCTCLACGIGLDKKSA